ncbi:hypothetical protein [Methylobacterium dankookense]|uniref:Uncharacterized protein n=1 Tax=Methylobacterium dankookense TaxID=560405 RepID=A0A564FS56_9HYPH|nr:hypothetical protein [Methylobacterium dankookense]GJD58935.1 hypothetical protein IFDJLNFL_4861 [Methylobacterium dankookense]VUF10560.1 hypothetical protein MTDSW087_00227 [Methylobacterium dankookense]
MQTRIITGLALGALGLAAITTAAEAGGYRDAAARAAAVERTGSVAVPRAYTSGGSAAVLTERASSYENTLHLFGARTDNAPF